MILGEIINDKKLASLPLVTNLLILIIMLRRIKMCCSNSYYLHIKELESCDESLSVGLVFYGVSQIEVLKI